MVNVVWAPLCSSPTFNNDWETHGLDWFRGRNFIYFILIFKLNLLNQLKILFHHVQEEFRSYNSSDPIHLKNNAPLSEELGSLFFMHTVFGNNVDSRKEWDKERKFYWNLAAFSQTAPLSLLNVNSVQLICIFSSKSYPAWSWAFFWLSSTSEEEIEVAGKNICNPIVRYPFTNEVQRCFRLATVNTFMLFSQIFSYDQTHFCTMLELPFNSVRSLWVDTGIIYSSIHVYIR